jgi:hypothetical protein
MKKIILTFCMSCVTLLPLAAQQNQVPGQRLEALKIAFITKELNLSIEEAQRFWPVYNKYADELRVLRTERKQNNSSEIDLDEKALMIRKKYNGDFSKVLSSEKANNFFRSEKKFNTFIIRELQERRLNRQQNQGRRPFNR